MRIETLVLVIVFCTVVCYCGVIDETLLVKGQDREKRPVGGQTEDGVSYGDWQEVVGDTPEKDPVAYDPNAEIESPDPPSVKQKRCPSTHQRLRSSPNFNGDQIVGSRTPIISVERREIQSPVIQKLCSSCKARASCKVYNKCEQCNILCMKVNPSLNTTAHNAMNETNDISNASNSNQINNIPNGMETDGIKVSFPNRFADTSMENNNVGDTRVSLPTPNSAKRVFTIANLATGSLKELICNLLGIQDTSDIDQMVVLVTTFTNKPPKFAQGRNESSQAKTLTESLNRELGKALGMNKNKGKQFLTNKEMEEVARKVLTTNPNIKASGARSSSSDEFLPTYPIDPNNMNFNTAPKLNPDVIEDTVDPRLLDNTRRAEQFPTAPRFGSKHEESGEESEEDSQENNGGMSGVSTAGQGGGGGDSTAGQGGDSEHLAPPTDLPVSPFAKEEGNEVPSTTSSNGVHPVDVTPSQKSDKNDTLRQPLKATPEYITGISAEEQESTSVPGKPSDAVIGSPNSLNSGKVNGNNSPMMKSEVEVPHIESQNGRPLKPPLVVNNDKTETISTLNEKEPSKPITKNLLQQFKDKMEQRVKSSKQNIPNISRSRFQPEDEKLRGNENSQTRGKLFPIESLGTKTLREKLKEMQGNKVKEETPSILQKGKEVLLGQPENAEQISGPITKTRPLSLDHLRAEPTKNTKTIKTMTENGPRVGYPPIRATANQDASKPDDTEVGSPNLEEGAVDSKISKITPTETVSSGNTLRENLSEILRALKKDVQLTPKIVDNFDTAAEVLKDVENIVDEIRKDTNIKSDDIKDLSMLGTAKEDQTTNVQDLSPPEVTGPRSKEPLTMAGAPTAKKMKPRIVIDRFQQNPLRVLELPDEVGRPQVKTDDTDTKIIGSPERKLWDKYMNARTSHHTNRKQNKDKPRLGSSSPMTGGSTFPVEKITDGIIPERTILGKTPSEIINKQSANNNIPEAIDSRNDQYIGSSRTPSGQNRVDSPAVGNTLKKTTWSNSLGTLIPFEQDQTSLTKMQSSDMYFVGNGIKLPLQMVRNDDGEVQLSVDLQRLCSCKNTTSCPENHTTIEQTLGSILTKQSIPRQELHGKEIPPEDLEEDAQNVSETEVEEESEERSTVVTHRNERGIRHGWLTLKDSIAKHLNPNEEYLQGEDNNVFKRSTAKSLETENIPHKITIPISNSMKLDKGQGRASDSKNIFLGIPNRADSSNSNIQENTDTFQQFLNNQLEELRSNMLLIERQNAQKHQQLQKTEEKLGNAIHGEMEDKEVNNMKTPDTDNYASKSFILPKPLLELNSNYKNQKAIGNEYDLVTPITSSAHKFKKPDSLQNKLEKYNEDEHFLKREVDILMKSQKNSFIKKEVDIMNNILEFLKTLAADKKE